MARWKAIFRRSKSHGPPVSNSNVEDYVGQVVADRENGSGGKARSDSAAKAGREEPLPNDVRDYYYPDMDKDSANDALQGRPVGTYLLRKSQCADAEYTLSARSERHVFNVRIFYQAAGDNGFHLDAPRRLRKYFPSISALLRYYSQAPRELIALCVNDGIDEKATLKLMYPLSHEENALHLDATDNNGPNLNYVRPPARLVTRQANGGSLKAMVKWL